MLSLALDPASPYRTHDNASVKQPTDNPKHSQNHNRVANRTSSSNISQSMIPKESRPYLSRTGPNVKRAKANNTQECTKRECGSHSEHSLPADEYGGYAQEGYWTCKSGSFGLHAKPVVGSNGVDRAGEEASHA